MKNSTFAWKLFLFICLFSMPPLMLHAQTGACFFKDTLFSIDFGAGNYVQDFNLKALKNYQRDYTTCPEDGYYSYVATTSNCFNGDWITLTEDHTPNDISGKMMLVNASETAGVFFIAGLAGFKPATSYEFSTWMLNVCKLNGGCPPLPPNILITLETKNGVKLAAFKTGRLLQSSNPAWKRYFGMFTTPADATMLFLKMENTTDGGCGNDFAMDDITFRECYPPPVASAPNIPVTKPTPIPAPAKEIAKQPIPVSKTIKRNVLVLDQPTAKDTAIRRMPVMKPGSNSNIPIPRPLLTRENPVIKTIDVTSGELLIELYDNGEIDGDTVSIYHNNELIVSRAGISEKPVQFRIMVDASQPYHEITMVAENLGSIPPNTSLMIISGNGKRYEVFISSSEQKNAKIIIKKKTE